MTLHDVTRVLADAELGNARAFLRGLDDHGLDVLWVELGRSVHLGGPWTQLARELVAAEICRRAESAQ